MGASMVTPDPISPLIIEIIESDIVAGNSDNINSICVNPNSAIRLYLEGKLTRSDILRAENYDIDTTVFKNIGFRTSIGIKYFDVICKRNSDFKIATIDVHGNVV